MEYYFPPLRDAGAALPLGVFGLLCILLPLAAAFALVSPGVPVSYGLLTLALVGGLIVPFMLCGIAFVALGLYMVTNSLRVSVDANRVVTERRILGWPVSRRELRANDVIAVESIIPARFQHAFGGRTNFRLVARAKQGRSRDVVVAESLHGDGVMEQMKQEIERACGLIGA